MKIMKEDKKFMENDKNSDIEEFLNKFIDETPKKLTREEKRFIKYSKKFKKRFGRNPYIAEPSGTIKATIKAIKKCLKENKDILDELLYNCPYKDKPDIKY